MLANKFLFLHPKFHFLFVKKGLIKTQSPAYTVNISREKKCQNGFLWQNIFFVDKNLFKSLERPNVKSSGTILRTKTVETILSVNISLNNVIFNQPNGQYKYLVTVKLVWTCGSGVLSFDIDLQGKSYFYYSTLTAIS